MAMRIASSTEPQFDGFAIRLAGAGSSILDWPVLGEKGMIKSVVTSLAGFESARSVVTSLAGFAGARRPQPPGGRTAIPAALR